MQNFGQRSAIAALVLVAASVQDAWATFHLMQIEQVIAGVNGDATMQAIQLRMRQAVENFVHFSRVRAWDATGSNPIMIIDMTHDVSNGQAGDRVLIVSPNLAQATNPPVVGDFVMTNLIPQTYLAAGSLTFEQDNGTVYWRLSWGGSAYTGSTLGQSDNDDDLGFVPADFGPPFAGPLPSTTLQALRFSGTASAVSTTNAADYALTVGAATFTNNARNSFAIINPPSPTGDIDGDRDVDLVDFALCIACLAGPDGDAPPNCPAEDFSSCDLDEDGGVDLLDIAEFEVLNLAP